MASRNIIAQDIKKTGTLPKYRQCAADVNVVVVYVSGVTGVADRSLQEFPICATFTDKIWPCAYNALRLVLHMKIRLLTLTFWSIKHCIRPFGLSFS